MSNLHESLIMAVRHYQESLDYYTEHRNELKLLHYIEKLRKLPIKVIHLEQTGVGKTVNGLRKLGGDVGDAARSLVLKWKEMVVGEEEAKEDEDEEDEDDEEEDGYQTGENDSDDKDSRDKNDKVRDTSSHRKSDNRTDDQAKKNKYSSKHENSASSSRDKHKSSEHKHKSYKRRNDDSSSEDETPKKRHKSDRRKIESDSDDDDKLKEKKRKHDKHKTEPRQDSSSDFEDSYKSKERHKEKEAREKDKDKHKRGEEAKKHDKKVKDRDRDKTKEREKDKREERVKSEKKPRRSSSKSTVSNGALITNGIDSGSGASFAEALGMCGPSSSKNAKKKPERSEKEKKEKEKMSPKVEDVVPKALKESHLDPVDINISSLLPTITPNYRPLGVLPVDTYKKALNDYEALSNIITSKNQRTKVYSGNKSACGKVPSLFELCCHILQDHIDALEYTGGVPYLVLKPILEKSNPNQLYTMEHHNPYLIEDTDELWQLHCQKEFRNKKREELETWREMYLRCLDERDAKLKALTANIKQQQDKSLPVRMTKLAYVDAVAKPPRNIARKQAKNGTAFADRKSTAVKLATLATSGEAGKIAVPNPGGRFVERTSTHTAKPKKAPLMLKSISSFKNRFKR